jgi:heme/copper-type cytochrome/quinol oxidase subunit 2
MPFRAALNETWFKAEKEGLYYGQCSELCGKDHAFMPIAIRVVSDATSTSSGWRCRQDRSARRQQDADGRRRWPERPSMSPTGRKIREEERDMAGPSARDHA